MADSGFATVRHPCLTYAAPWPHEIFAWSRPCFVSSLAFLSAMALHLMFPALPAGVNEPGSGSSEGWLELAEDGMLLEAVYDYWEDDGRPHVAVDASVSLGAFLVPVVALRGGNASLPLHILEFLFARFLVLAPELTGTLHPGYCFGALAISPARLERAFGSLVSAGLDTAVSSADGAVRAVLALHPSVTFAHAQWALAADDLIQLQGGHTPQDMAPLLFPLSIVPLGGEHPTRRWISDLELAAMRCLRFSLAPVADLVGFCGVRAFLADPGAPVPPLTGEYRATIEALTDLTRAAVASPPAPVFARGSGVVDFFRNRPWPPSLAGWPAALVKPWCARPNRGLRA